MLLLHSVSVHEIDCDLCSGSMDVMERTRERVIDKGASFNNAFATSPICCPSRSSFLTGQISRFSPTCTATSDRNISLVHSNVAWLISASLLAALGFAWPAGTNYLLLFQWMFVFSFYLNPYVADQTPDFLLSSFSPFRSSGFIVWNPGGHTRTTARWSHICADRGYDVVGGYFVFQSWWSSESVSRTVRKSNYFCRTLLAQSSRINKQRQLLLFGVAEKIRDENVCHLSQRVWICYWYFCSAFFFITFAFQSNR